MSICSLELIVYRKSAAMSLIVRYEEEEGSDDDAVDWGRERTRRRSLHKPDSIKSSESRGKYKFITVGKGIPGLRDPQIRRRHVHLDNPQVRQPRHA
jgi:hypothetical protein